MPNPQNLRAPWKPGESGNPKGRPPDRVRKYRQKILSKSKAKKFYGISATETLEWLETLVTFGLPELKLIAQDDDAPTLVRSYARALIFDMNAGKTTTLDKICEKLYGKAIQRIEHTGADGSDLMAARTLTKEEARELLGSLEQEY